MREYQTWQTRCRARLLYIRLRRAKRTCAAATMCRETRRPGYSLSLPTFSLPDDLIHQEALAFPRQLAQPPLERFVGASGGGARRHGDKDQGHSGPEEAQQEAHGCKAGEVSRRGETHAHDAPDDATHNSRQRWLISAIVYKQRCVCKRRLLKEEPAHRDNLHGAADKFGQRQPAHQVYEWILGYELSHVENGRASNASSTFADHQ